MLLVPLMVTVEAFGPFGNQTNKIAVHLCFEGSLLQELSKAYEVLRDPDRRRQYDAGAVTT